MSRGALWLRRHPAAGAGVIVAGLIIVLTLVVWALPALLTRRPTVSGAERHRAVADTRTGLIAMLGALGAAGGLAYTARTFHLSQLAQLTGRFQTASKQMGENDPTVRLGGLQAMAQLADEWTSQRQRCVDVLCAYVREAANRDEDSRRRAVELITERLSGKANWIGCDFDFTNADFRTGDFSGADFSGGRISFAGVHWQGRVRFDGAVFTGAEVSFAEAHFLDGCDVSFDSAEFCGGSVNFDGARFNGGIVHFQAAVFRPACRITFEDARLGNGGDVRFDGATFAAGDEFSGIRFDHAWFGVDAGGDVTFRDATFRTCVSFDDAQFYEDVTFEGASLADGALSFRRAFFREGRVAFDGARCAGTTFFTAGATSQGGCIDIQKAHGAPDRPDEKSPSNLFC